MTSPLPPRLRDSRNLADLVRQLKQNGRQVDGGLLGGRWSPAKPLGATAQLGDLEDDDPLDDDLPAAWNTDQVTAAVAGSISLNLTYVPIDGTLLVFWDGIYLHPSEYVLTGQTVTFTDRHIHVGHQLAAAYWYWPSDVEEPEPIDPVLPASTFGFESDWRYLFTTAATDYSAAGFDDSGWTVGVGGFWRVHFYTTSWPKNTAWPAGQTGWFRRGIGARAGTETVTIRHAGNATVWLDGVQIVFKANGVPYIADTFPLPPGAAGVLAVKVTSMDSDYFDMQVV